MNKVPQTKPQKPKTKAAITQKKRVLIGAFFILCALVLKRDAH